MPVGGGPRRALPDRGVVVARSSDYAASWTGERRGDGRRLLVVAISAGRSGWLLAWASADLGGSWFLLLVVVRCDL